MQESLIKLVLVLIAIASLAVGGVLLIIPGSYVTLAEAEAMNLSWLRGLGGSVVALQGVGILISAFRRRDTNPLVGMAVFATTVQAGALFYSLFVGELGASRNLVSIIAGVLATAAAVLLWFVWLARRKSVRTLSPRGSRSAADSAGSRMPEEPPQPDAELIEEIDSQSPRFKK
jgi:hypothetical protein